jgi:hypothetical protein
MRLLGTAGVIAFAPAGGAALDISAKTSDKAHCTM